MSDIESVLERCESAEFKATCSEIARELWAVINDTINEKAPTVEKKGVDPDWELFYLPAMRHGILRRLKQEATVASAGWYEVFCNNIREVSPDE